MKHITKIALLNVDSLRDTLLCVKKRGLDKWISPGGKREPGESDHDCIYRELNEELGIPRVRICIREKPYMVCQGIAEGTTDVELTLICYLGSIKPGSYMPNAEIEYYVFAPLHLHAQLPLAWSLKYEVMPALCRDLRVNKVPS